MDYCRDVMSQWKPKGRAAVIRATNEPGASSWEGKYEDLCLELSERTEANGVLLLILEGNRGTGFQTTFKVGGGLDNSDVPRMLRAMATQLETAQRKANRASKKN